MRIGIDIRTPQAPTGQQRYLWRLGCWLAGEGHQVYLLCTKQTREVPTLPQGCEALSLQGLSRRRLRERVRSLGLHGLLINPERDMQYFGIRANVLRPGYGTDQGRQKSRSVRNPLERTLRAAVRISPPLLWRRYRERWFYRPGDGTTPQVIAISNYMRQEILDSHTVNPDRIHLIHNGVDLSEFTPDRRKELRREWRHHWDIPADAFCILSVGHNFRRKGVWEAMEHVEDLKAAGEDVYLLVAGRGTGRRQRRTASSLARNHGISDRVRLAGIVHPSIRAFAAADVLLFPSWHDAFGFVILEAMACGLPVITTPYAGGSEVLANGVSGFVIDPEKPEEIRASLREMAQPDRRAAMGAEARNAAEEHGEESNFRRVEEVFRLAAEGGRGPIV